MQKPLRDRPCAGRTPGPAPRTLTLAGAAAGAPQHQRHELAARLSIRLPPLLPRALPPCWCRDRASWLPRPRSCTPHTTLAAAHRWEFRSFTPYDIIPPPTARPAARRGRRATPPPAAPKFLKRKGMRKGLIRHQRVDTSLREALNYLYWAATDPSCRSRS